MVMPITLPELRARITPKTTSLLLGAGASVPSGAPSGADLAHLLWRKIEHTEPQSDDLTETATLLVRKHTRRPVIELIVKTLSGLVPTGGLLALPKFQWRQVFTTNYDRLVENAYKAQNISVVPIRSNYDFSNTEGDEGTRLLKLHGCITQDASLGDKSSMILTEDDYELHRSYRQAMFSSLETALLTGDVLVIGQSLNFS
jgi:hypothetical protein